MGVRVDAAGQGGGLDLGGHGGGRRGERDRAGAGPGGADPEAGRLEQGPDQVEVAERPVGVLQLGRLRAQVPGEGGVHGAVALLGFELVPDLDGDGASRGGHPGHLAQGGGPVGEEHEAGLAEDDVERPVLERQLARVTQAPLDVGAEPAGHRQHALVEVQAGHPAPAAHPVGGRPGHHPGATGDVEHGLGRGDPGRLDQVGRPVGEERGHEPGLVHLGRLDRELERLDGPGHYWTTLSARTSHTRWGWGGRLVRSR